MFFLRRRLLRRAVPRFWSAGIISTLDGTRGRNWDQLGGLPMLDLCPLIAAFSKKNKIESSTRKLSRIIEFIAGVTLWQESALRVAAFC